LALPAIADLLSLPARHPAPELSPQQRKEKTLAALLAQLNGLVRKQPVLMLFEDLPLDRPDLARIVDGDRRSRAALAGAGARDRSSGVYAALAQPSALLHMEIPRKLSDPTGTICLNLTTSVSGHYRLL
jgi:hypothetical protein